MRSCPRALPRARCWHRPRTRRPTSRRRTARREAQVTAGEQSRSTDRPGLLDGPFTTPQLLRLDEALRLADRSTGLTFSVYVGELGEPVRRQVEKLHGQLADPDRSVLVAVSPNQRVLEIVTGGAARKRIPD